MKAIHRASLLAMAAGLLRPVEWTSAADQPQWGQAWSRNMVSAERGLPECFDPTTGRNVRWSARLGTETHSTPVVAGGRVLVGTNNGEPRDPRNTGDRGVLLCFDERTGEFLWELAVPKITNSIFWDWPKAGICSPATVESNRVYIISNRGEVLCLDLEGMANGNQGPFMDEARHRVPLGQPPVEPNDRSADILWRFDIIKECGVRQHDSAHGSILIDGPFLYVNTSNGVDDTHKQIHAPEAPSLIVLNKQTGQLVARDQERIGPRIFHSTWSSPALAEVQGRRLVYFCGGDGVIYGFEPVPCSLATKNEGPVAGLKKVWWFDCDPGAPKENVHRYNSNRKESPSNIKSMPVIHGDRLYVTVGGDLWWGKNQAWLKCVDLTGTGDVTAGACRWTYDLTRHSMSSPAVADGLVYVGDSGQRIHCVDGRTGEACWTHPVKGEVWASPLVADGKVYFATRGGQVLVFAAGRDKKLLCQVELGEAVSGSPMAANGTLYLATMRQLYALASGIPPVAPAASP